jgi:hypothetical protein
MSLIRGLSSSLSGIMPDAQASMQDLSQILGDVLVGSSVDNAGIMDAGISENPDTIAILEEANSIIERQTKVAIPEVPDGLKHEIIQRRAADVLV